MRSFTLPEVGVDGPRCPMTSPWQSVSGCFRSWKKSRLWPKMHEKLDQKVGAAGARHKEPWAGMIDSQAVKTTEQGGPL